jgi:tetratricopeptide (TPR) repeat protein
MRVAFGQIYENYSSLGWIRIQINSSNFRIIPNEIQPVDVDTDRVSVIHRLKEEQQIYILHNNFEQSGEVCLKIAREYSLINDLEDAVHYYFEALRSFENCRNAIKLVVALHGIAELNIESGNQEIAIQYLQKSFRVLSLVTRRNDSLIAKTNMLMGIAYGYLEQADSAMKYFDRVLDYAKMSGDNEMQAGIRNNIGAIYSKLGRLDEARASYNEALTIFKNIGHERGRAVSLSNLAYLSLKEKKYSEAIAMYEEVIPYFLINNDLAYLETSYSNLSEIYSLVGNEHLELQYLKLYDQAKDSLKSSEMKQLMLEKETRDELQKKENQMQLIEAQMKIVDQQNRIRGFFQIVLIAGIVVISIIGFLIFRNMRVSIKNEELKKNLLVVEKQRLANELTYKSKELENFAISVVEKNEFLEVLRQEVESVEGTNKDYEKLVEISKSIRHNLYIDRDKQELHTRINELHGGFLFKLNEKHPDLSKSERKLCSLIVLDLSSKDIAALMNISAEGVKKSRYRLRKKLQLESDDSLNEYLALL